MPSCQDCGMFIQSGARCRPCRHEHQHGTLSDRREEPTCPACQKPVKPGQPTKSIHGQTGHKECGGQVRCDGGQRHTDLPAPDRFFQAIGDGEVDMEVLDHDEVRFRTNHVPGGSFGLELIASYSYAGYDCRQHISLTRESAEALRDTLDEILESDPRGAGGDD